jgi:hypothetical protein
MESRIAAISIIVESPDSVERLINLLHDYRQYIIGRMAFHIITEASPLSAW